VVSKLDGAAGEVSGDSTGHRDLVPGDAAAEPLDRVAEIRRRLSLPSRDGRTTSVLLSFVDDDGAVIEDCATALASVVSAAKYAATGGGKSMGSAVLVVMKVTPLEPDSQFGNLPLCDRELMVHHERIG